MDKALLLFVVFSLFLNPAYAASSKHLIDKIDYSDVGVIIRVYEHSDGTIEELIEYQDAEDDSSVWFFQIIDGEEQGPKRVKKENLDGFAP